MSIRVLVVSLALVTLSFIAACDLFGQIRCNKASECPDNLPFCTSGACSKTDENGRDGRGIGEGEGEGEGGGSCSGDGDCTPGACYDLADGLAPQNTCVPTATDDASCPEAASLNNPSGLVIFSGTATRAAGDCSPGTQNVNVEVKFFSRSGISDVNALSLIAVTEGGTSPTLEGGGSVESADGHSGDAFMFDHDCVPDSAAYVAIGLGETSPESNALCLPLAAP